MKARVGSLFVVLALWFASGVASSAELVSRLFSDHMIMQRNIPVPVWGRAEPGEAVTVTIGRQIKTVKADGSGKWMVRLDSMQPGAPLTMTVKTGSRVAEVRDILVGEVWVASGQSNMSWLLKHSKNAKEEIAQAAFPEIRFFSIRSSVAPMGPMEDLPPDSPAFRNANMWLPSAPDTAGDFSAVAYFFARDLHRSLRVPVGIISNAVGSSPIEAWISRNGYMTDPDFKVVAEFYDGITNYVENTPEGRKDLADISARYEAIQAERRATKKPPLWPRKYPGPVENLGRASTLYNALVSPVIPYAMRGVIWYQGEAHGRRMDDYRGLFPLLIRDWRKQWGQGDFPFLYVQLANWGAVIPNPNVGGWAHLRESQLMALSVPRTGMAVTIDIGERGNIHPGNKQDVGRRLALAARNVAYAEKLVHSGPVYREMKVEGGAIRLFFDHTGTGLMAGRKLELEPVTEDPQGKLKYFAIAGEDMKFVWADAAIDGDTVTVSSPSVARPAAVRYAWAPNPEGANLYNREGLPASPFRTDRSKPVVMGAFYRSQIKEGFALEKWRPIHMPPDPTVGDQRSPK